MFLTLLTYLSFCVLNFNNYLNLYRTLFVLSEGPVNPITLDSVIKVTDVTASEISVVNFTTDITGKELDIDVIVEGVADAPTPLSFKFQLNESEIYNIGPQLADLDDSLVDRDGSEEIYAVRYVVVVV